MPKYTRDQLRDMAQEWAVDHTAGGEKSFQVVMQLCLKTGLGADTVIEKINALAADGVDCHA